MSLAFRNVLYSIPQAFAALEKKKEDVYREETTFCNRRESLESLEYAERKWQQPEQKSWAHTHTFTRRLLYPRC